MKRTLKRLAGMTAAGLGILGLVCAPVAQAAEPAPVLISDIRGAAYVTADRADPDLFMQPPNAPAAGLQQWVLKIDEKTGQGLVINEATGGCLAVYRVVIGDRKPLAQRPCDGQPTEVWTVKQGIDGSVVFVSAYTGSCMGFEPIFVGIYPQLLEFDCTGGSNQVFRLKPA